MKRLSNTNQNSTTLTNIPTPSSGGDAVNKTYADLSLLKSQNLNDLASASTARSNLGLGALAVLATVGTTQIDDEAVTSRKLAPTVILESCTGDVTLNSTTLADITGCTSTFTPDIASYAIVTAYVNYRGGSAANDVFQVTLDVDGTPETRFAMWGVPTSSGQVSTSQSWLISLSAASHTLKLRGKRLSGTGSAIVEADHTCMTIMLIGNDNVTNS